ncbi:MAG TPA: 1,2-phenylacetyl-CoA epoxidase subunit PaaD [Kineosporiaceae bacterium]|nr:1,2-phenylacetyl-CoA epoxidase subunit PaaD [Kineosporiaceae bacterium]
MPDTSSHLSADQGNLPVDERADFLDRRGVEERGPAQRAWEVAGAVPDPEVPVLTIADLGVLREVTLADDGTVDVTITPTYSGCPAMDTIRADVEQALREAGFGGVRVRTVLAPAWTTDWITDRGRSALEEYGIAPPGPRANGPVRLALSVRCPQCGSPNTRELSRFASTACKSLWQCRDCSEPFDHFKTL